MSEEPSESPSESPEPTVSVVPSSAPAPGPTQSVQPSSVPSEAPSDARRVGVDSRRFKLLYRPAVIRIGPNTMSELEDVTAEYLDFYLGLAFATPTMADVNFSDTVVRQASFNTFEKAGYTEVTFDVTANFEPTLAQPTVPDSATITRMVRDAFTNTFSITDPDWVAEYIMRLRGLPVGNGFRNTVELEYARAPLTTGN